MRALFVLITLFAATVYAGESTYRVTTSHPLEIIKEGSIEDALSLSNLWREKVLDKNPHIIKTEYLLEKQSETRYELLAIYYYKNRDTAAKANKLLGGLIEKAWPDEVKRKAFFARLQSYVVHAERKTRRYDVIINGAAYDKP